MEWETTGRGAGLGATRGFVVAVLGLRGLSDIRVEVSSSRWVLCFRVEGRQVRMWGVISSPSPPVLPFLCLGSGREGQGPPYHTPLLRWIMWSPAKTPSP